MHGRGRGMNWSQGDPMDSFDPMSEAYRDTGFNSYVSGPGSHMNTSMQVEMRRREDGGNFKLYVGNIPPNLQESGLRNLFSTVGDPINIHIQVKPNTKLKWAFIEFRTMSEAQRAIFQLDNQPPHFLTVQAAKGDNEKAERRRYFEDSKPFPGQEDVPIFPGGDRGRGTLPPMRGVHPKNLKHGPKMFEPQPYYDPHIHDNGYSMDRFQHYKADPYLESANEEFSTMTLSVSSDGQRQVVLGRGSFMPDNGDSRRFRPPFYRHRLDEIVKNCLNNLYYTSKKDDIYQFSNDDGREKISCVKCGSHAIRMCCDCKSAYCTHECMKSDRERHESICQSKLQNGEFNSTSNEENIPGNQKSPSSSKRQDYSSDTDNKSSDKNFKGKHSGQRKGSLEQKGFGNRNQNKFPKKTFVRGKPVPNNDENDYEMGKALGFDEKTSKAAPFDPKRTPNKNEMARSTQKFPIPENVFTKVAVILKEDTNIYWVQDSDSIILQAQIVRDLNRFIMNGEATCLSSVYPKAKCAALFQGDWYRAKVVSVEPQLKVLFVDYGNEEICKPEDLRTLPKDMMILSPIAFKIRLAAGTRYADLEPEDTLSVKPLTKDSSDVWLVQVEGESFPAEAIKLDLPNTSQLGIFDNFTKVILVVKDSETEYWVQLASRLKEFFELTKELEMCTSVKIIPELGGTYAKLYLDTWCRAKVVQLNPMKVFYTDYGNYEVVAPEDLHPLPATCCNIPPMAFRIKLADGTPATYFEMNPNREISVKGVGELEDGTVIVQIEGEVYKTTIVTQMEVPRRPKNSERSRMGHVLYMVEPGMKFDLKVQRVVSDDHVTCTVLPRDFNNTSFVSLNDIAQKLADIDGTKMGYKPKLGDMVCVELKSKRSRGYVMGVWEKEVRVALVDFASVLCVSKCIAPLPKELQDIPEAGVRCLFEVSTIKGIEMEELVLNCTAQCYKGNILTVEIEGFGTAEIVPWEPLIEEGGLPTIEIPTGTKVLLTAHRTSEAVYVQSNRPEHLEILSTLLQDVGAHCIKAPPLDRKPLTGEMVGCIYIDGSYYRAQVYERVDDEFNVVFLDYGNSEKVSHTLMRPLPTNLKLVPCCAVKIGLKGVPRTPLSSHSIKYLNELATTQEELILSYESDLGQATLCSARGISLNKTLADMAEPVWKKALSNNRDPSDGHVFMAPDLTYVKWHMKKKLSVMILASAGPNVKVAAATTISYINHVASILVEQMSEYCEATPRDQSYNPRMNEICIAKFDDGKWYRALCLQPKQTTSELLFIDYGNYGDVLQRNIRCMTPDFISSPAMLKRMKIYGIPDKVNKKAETELEKILSEGSVHQVVVVDEKEDGNVTVWIPSIGSRVVDLGLPPIAPPGGNEKY